MAAPATDRRAQQDAHPSGDERFALLDKALKRARFEQDQLVELLHTAQEVFGHLSDDVLIYLARQLRLPPSRVLGVASFYHLFTFEPPGDHICTVCMGTACYVKGAEDVVRETSEAFDVPAGETTDDGRLTLWTARCVGSCGLAPVVVFDGTVLAKQTPQDLIAHVRELLAAEDAAAEEEAG